MTTVNTLLHRARERLIIISDGSQQQPLGVLYANDALEAMLNEVENNEEFLRDYVMGTGYR